MLGFGFVPPSSLRGSPQTAVAIYPPDTELRSPRRFAPCNDSAEHGFGFVLGFVPSSSLRTSAHTGVAIYPPDTELRSPRRFAPRNDSAEHGFGFVLGFVGLGFSCFAVYVMPCRRRAFHRRQGLDRDILGARGQFKVARRGGHCPPAGAHCVSAARLGECAFANTGTGRKFLRAGDQWSPLHPHHKCGAERAGRGYSPLPRHCEPVLTLVWQSVLLSVLLCH